MDLQEAENKEESRSKSEAVGGVVKVEGEVPEMILPLLVESKNLRRNFPNKIFVLCTVKKLHF